LKSSSLINDLTPKNHDDSLVTSAERTSTEVMKQKKKQYRGIEIGSWDLNISFTTTPIVCILLSLIKIM